MFGQLIKERIVSGVSAKNCLELNINRYFLVTDIHRVALLLILCWIVAGCVSPHTAPIVESQQNLARVPPSEDIKPRMQNKQLYTVQRGDTLYGIALKHGVDYKELVQWNGIADPNTLKIGQEIDLLVPSRQSKVAESAPEGQSVQPTLFALPQPAAPAEVSSIKPLQVEPISSPPGAMVIAEPKSIKLPYSEPAVIKPDLEVTPPTKSQSTAILPSPNKIEKSNDVEKPAKNQPEVAPPRSNNSIKWSWPTNGKILSKYSERTKGVSISGNAGQSVLASADGTVVYSGNSLRGYGNLIIVKHNDIYLSAYGHNSKILVREGETVSKGQKIAEMGNTDSETVRLHFEIRERGKPVDPLRFLSN